MLWKSRKGFTLIELLVVIAIIGVLAGLLLPALSKARERAKLVKCSNTLKQLAIAFNLYADDNHGKFPPYRVPWGGGWGWYDVVQPYMGRDIEDRPPTEEYGGILHCPGAPGEYGDKIWKGSVSMYVVKSFYRLNCHIDGADESEWAYKTINPDKARAASETVVVWCSWSIEGGSKPTPFLRPDTHKMGRPVMYADSHVQIHREPEYIDCPTEA